MKVLLIALEPERVDPHTVERIKQMARGYEVIVTRDEGQIRERLPHIEIAVGLFPHALLAEARGIRWYQQHGAGSDWLMNHPELAERQFLLTNSSGVHAIPITEHIMTFLLCFARGFKSSILGQRGRVWEENRRQPLLELDGKRIVLVGVGAIGSHFAKVASAFGMQVVGVRRTSGHIPGTIRTVTRDRLDEELPEADFLVLTVPLTAETRHMIDAARLALLKPTAYLVNIGRGGTVDEEALVAALSAKRLAGAGLDVFETEPLPESSPLWDLENVIITPHYSGITPRYVERLMEIFLDNLERYFADRPLRNLVDRGRGY